MMIKINVQGLQQLSARIDNMGKQVRFAAANALTETAKMVERASVVEMERVLDRPTEFTKRGLFITPARKDNLAAVVGFKDAQARYMQMQIEGGTRSPGSRGIKLPGNVVLNQYGNIPKGEIAKLLAAVRTGKYGAGVKRRLGVVGRGKSGLELFYGQPKNHPSMPVGIYRVTPKGISLVVAFSQKSARYRPRFKFYELATRVAQESFQANFDEAFAKAISTSLGGNRG